jgi:hypothetical protein
MGCAHAVTREMWSERILIFTGLIVVASLRLVQLVSTGQHHTAIYDRRSKNKILANLRSDKSSSQVVEVTKDWDRIGCKFHRIKYLPLLIKWMATLIASPVRSPLQFRLIRVHNRPLGMRDANHQ